MRSCGARATMCVYDDDCVCEGAGAAAIVCESAGAAAMHVRRCACVTMACADGGARVALVCARQRCVCDGGAPMMKAC